MEFTAILERFDSKLWGHHFKVPAAIAKAYIGKDRRVVCTLNGSLEFQCALMPHGDGSFFINLNKEIRDKLGLKIGSALDVHLRKDESEFGLPMPEELQELLNQDEEGNRFFQALTPGKKRNLLYIVGSAKNQDSRIGKAVVVVEHLKLNGGKINYRQLGEELKKG